MERDRGRGRSRLPLSREQNASAWGWIQGPQDHDLSWRQMLNQLSHPCTLQHSFLKEASLRVIDSLIQSFLPASKADGLFRPKTVPWIGPSPFINHALTVFSLNFLATALATYFYIFLALAPPSFLREDSLEERRLLLLPSVLLIKDNGKHSWIQMWLLCQNTLVTESLPWEHRKKWGDFLRVNQRLLPCGFICSLHKHVLSTRKNEKVDE